jgi:hypothetical protein
MSSVSPPRRLLAGSNEGNSRGLDPTISRNRILLRSPGAADIVTSYRPLVAIDFSFSGREIGIDPDERCAALPK